MPRHSHRHHHHHHGFGRHHHCIGHHHHHHGHGHGGGLLLGSLALGGALGYAAGSSRSSSTTTRSSGTSTVIVTTTSTPNPPQYYGYGAPAPYTSAYGAPPPHYAPAYGAPPPAYGAPPSAYGAPPPAYGAPPPAYGAPPPVYGAPSQPHPQGYPQASPAQQQHLGYNQPQGPQGAQYPPQHYDNAREMSSMQNTYSTNNYNYGGENKDDYYEKKRREEEDFAQIYPSMNPGYVNANAGPASSVSPSAPNLSATNLYQSSSDASHSISTVSSSPSSAPSGDRNASRSISTGAGEKCHRLQHLGEIFTHGSVVTLHHVDSRKYVCARTKGSTDAEVYLGDEGWDCHFIVEREGDNMIRLRSQRLHYDYLRIPSPQRLDIGSLMEKAGDFYVISHPGEKYSFESVQFPTAFLGFSANGNLLEPCKVSMYSQEGQFFLQRK